LQGLLTCCQRCNASLPVLQLQHRPNHDMFHGIMWNSSTTRSNQVGSCKATDSLCDLSLLNRACQSCRRS
jgi:hypothetical protein